MATRYADSDVEEILQKRVAATIHQLPRETIVEALEAPSKAEMMSIITVAFAGTVPADVGAVIRSRLATAEFKERMIKAADGVMTADEVIAAVDRYGSPQAVSKAANERRLLVVDLDGRKAYPAFQFKDPMPVVLPKVLKAAPSVTGWGMLQFLFGHPEGLAGKRPIDLLTGSEDDVDTVVRFARAMED